MGEKVVELSRMIKGKKRCGTEKIDLRDADYDVGFCFRKTERVTSIQRFF